MRMTTHSCLAKHIAPWWVWACCRVLPAISGADSHPSGDSMMMMESPSAMTAVTMMTTVVAVSGQEVTLGAGSRSGMVMAAEVTLLRQGQPIVHPLTGQILGVP
jgi:hypothetical protein